MKKLAVLDDFLVRDYLIKILGEGEEFMPRSSTRTSSPSPSFSKRA
jgi:hypothetical protein